MSNFLQPHGLQHTRLPCPSPTPRACLNSCPLSWWCHLTISSSVVPFSSCLQSFPALVFSNESVLHIRWPKYLNHCEPQAPHPNMAMRLNLPYRVAWRSERNCTWKLHGTKKHLNRWKLLPWLMSGSTEMLPSSSRWQKMDLQTRGLPEVECAWPKVALLTHTLKRINPLHLKVRFQLCRYSADSVIFWPLYVVDAGSWVLGQALWLH